MINFTSCLAKINKNLFDVNWLAVHAYASQRSRARYAGSVLGEFWMVATTAVFLVSVALVWSIIWRIPLTDYFAYFATGFIFNTFISGTINESTSILIADSRLYLNAKLSPMFSVFAHLYRSILSFSHHLIIALPVSLTFSAVNSGRVGMMVCGFLLCLAFMVPSCFLLGMLCVRYRDLLHVVHMIFQILFLVTPVMWQIDRIPEEFQYWVFLNPIASFLNITRDALLGLQVYTIAIISALVWVFIAWLVYLMLAHKLERHFSVWL